MSLAIAFRDLVKDFGSVRVLHGLNLALQPGRVYGLLGENGAGKSTLMKILAGHESASSGQVLVDGVARAPGAGPRAAEAQGIVLIHQEFNLADDLTIAQNIFLGHEIRRGLFLDDRAMHAQTRQALAQVGLRLAPQTRVRQLIVAEKQLVEIARALARNARLLIMDEPTATLTSGETERLFALIAALKAAGVTIVYISHKLDEVQRTTDEVIVLRDGRLVARARTAQLTRARMAHLMVGRELAELFPEKPPMPTGAPLLKVTGLSVPGWARDIGFELRRGEILGFAGLVGAGRTECFEGLLGLRPRSAGNLELAGRALQIDSPRSAARHGITYLSEDRKGKGLHLQMALCPNLTLMALARYARPWLDRAAEQAALRSAVAEFGIRSASLALRAAALSGGNQQKLALARVLHPGPCVLILDEPTRGVDVGAKREIYQLIRRLADQGLALVLISSELMELIGLCHRVAVLRAGRLQATLQGPNLTEQELIAHATGTR